MERPFSYPIYQQAKRLYQQDRIKNIQINNNSVSATITDGTSYNVKLIFNSNQELTGKSCDCTYAKFYQECKHMAAVYMEVTSNDLLKQQEKTIKELYEVYVSSKARPTVKNYSDFEYQVKKQFTKFAANNDFKMIRSYIDSIEQLYYPRQRIIVILQMGMDALKNVQDKNVDEMVEWIKTSFIYNKNTEYHDLFMDFIKKLDINTRIFLCEELIHEKNIQLNLPIYNQLMILLYDAQLKTIDEFENEYPDIKNIEVFYYLQIKQLTKEEKYASIKELYEEYLQKYANGIFKKEIQEMVAQSKLYIDPLAYMHQIIQNMVYWNPNFRDFRRAKKQMGNKWKDYRYEIYQELMDHINFSSFKVFLESENEIDYVEEALMRNPQQSYYEVFSSIVEKHDPKNLHFFLLNMLVNELKETNNSKFYEYVIEKLTIVKDKNKTDFDYMAYLLREYFPNRKKLIAMLDELEDDYESNE